MAKLEFLSVRVGIACVAGGALLVGLPSTLSARPAPISPEVRPAAVWSGAAPASLDGGEVPINVDLPGVGGSRTSYEWLIDNPQDAATGLARLAGRATTQTVLGPNHFNVTNLAAITYSARQNRNNPAGSEPALHAVDTTTWSVGTAGMWQSVGTFTAATDNTFGSGNGGYADGYLNLQLANQLGPMVFNLNVLKSLSFTQPPNGAVLANGQLDDFRALDIGRWTVGIPGVFSNSGTVGFMADYSYGNGLGAYRGAWGIHTTTQILGQSLEFTWLPAISLPSLGFTTRGELAPGDAPNINVPITSPVAGQSADVVSAPFNPGTPASTVATPSSPSATAVDPPIAPDAKGMPPAPDEKRENALGPAVQTPPALVAGPTTGVLQQPGPVKSSQGITEIITGAGAPQPGGSSPKPTAAGVPNPTANPAGGAEGHPAPSHDTDGQP